MNQLGFVNTQTFRESALYFEKNGRYDDGVVGTIYNKDYWKTELDRCINGYSSGGVRISGYHYHYLNYCKIEVVERTFGEIHKTLNKNAKVHGDRKEMFPDFWDVDYEFFMAADIAEYGISIEEYKRLPIDLNINEGFLTGGHHLLWLKPRGVGASWKLSSMAERNYACIRTSKTYMLANDKTFLTEDGLWSKYLSMRDWQIANAIGLGKSSDFKKDRSNMHMEASREVNGQKVGYKSEVIGVSLNNDWQKARGKRGKLLLWEEFGKFPNADKAWRVARRSVEQGNEVFGLMVGVGTGGCVCAGTVVWDNDGVAHNIENLPLHNGILGFDGEKVSKEDITYWQRPTQKQCYRITTNTRRDLECSEDHPIFANKKGEFHRIVDIKSTKKDKRKIYKTTKWVETKDLKIGDYVAIAEEVNIFSTNTLWNPRVTGWLIGDGSYGNKASPVLSNCEEEINEYIYREFECSTNFERVCKDGKIYKETTIKNIIPYLREIGIYGQTKLQKTLPYNIHSYTQFDIEELIGGLYDTDGYISIRENKIRGSYIGEISLSSASLDLLNEVRFLLQKLGIHGTIRRREPRENNPRDKNAWFEYIISSAKSLVKFADSILLFPKEKQNRLNKIREAFKNQESHDNTKGIIFEQIVKIEDIGIKNVYNLTANNTNTYIANGIITHNTKDANFEALKTMHYDPLSYNILAFNNVYGENKIDNKIVGMFTPAYKNVAFKDKDGNSDIEGAKEYLESEREIAREARDQATLPAVKAEDPFTPEEAVLVTGKNLFVSDGLINHAKYIENSNLYKTFPTAGIFEKRGLELKFSPKEGLEPVYKFPNNANSTLEGAVLMYYDVFKKNDRVPAGLYKIWVDTYEHDASTGDSIGAIYVVEQPNNFTPTRGDIIVATFIGRPEEGQEKFNSILFQLGEYYGGDCGNPYLIAFENDKPGDVGGFATRKHKLHYLADEMQLAFNEEIKTSDKSRRSFGISMNSGKENKRKKQGDIYSKNWIYKVRFIKPDGSIVYNYHAVKDLGLLQEWINYDIDANRDRHSAWRVGMYHQQELEYQEEVPMLPMKKDSISTFFERSLF